MKYEDIQNDADHVEAIIEDFKARVGPKYNRGIAEHGGDLRRKSSDRAMDEEIIDMNVYWFNIRYHKWKVTQLLKKVLESENLVDAKEYAKQALNVSIIGNEEGKYEADK